MKSISRSSLLMAAACLCLSSFVAFAQTASAPTAAQEKISLRMVPKQNQSSKISMTSEFDLEMTFEGDIPPELAALNPMKMFMKSVSSFTQKTGPLNKEGLLELELLFDDSTIEMTMNGNPLPAGEGQPQLKGKKIKVTLDQQGNVSDVQASADMGMNAASFKELMKSLYGALPTEPMAVGETAVVPLNMALPIPVTGQGSLNMLGETKVKLLAIEKEGGARVAKLESVVEGKMDMMIDFPGPNGMAKMKMEFKLSGRGPSAVNLDTVTIKHSDSVMEMSGKISPPANSTDAKLPTIVLKGKMKMGVVGN